MTPPVGEKDPKPSRFEFGEVVRLEGIEPPAFRSGARSAGRPLVADDRRTLLLELGLAPFLGRW